MIGYHGAYVLNITLDCIATLLLSAHSINSTNWFEPDSGKRPRFR